jgi:endoglucanase
MGAVNKNNTLQRNEWAKYYIKNARKFHMAVILWDNGIFDNSLSATEVFGMFKRNTLTWLNSDSIDLYIAYSSLPFEEIDLNDLFQIDLIEHFNKDSLVVDRKSLEFNVDVTAAQISKEIGMGWNLGNTLDAFSDSIRRHNQGLQSETSWGNPETTEEMIKTIAETGFKSIRIPVTWHNHLVDDSYTIDPEWMKRVKTIVNWGIKHGLYVILNSHHDIYTDPKNPLVYGRGYYPTKRDIIESEKFIYNIWKQITTAFNNGYDHHLIFEGLNEPRLLGTEYEWWYKVGDPLCEEGASVLNEYMRLIVKAIRESGGNNEKRFIMVTPLAAGYQAAIESPFEFPHDSKYNGINRKLILSVHMYAPYNLALNADKNYTKFEEGYKAELTDNFKTLYQKYVENGRQVIIGEMGIVNKNNTKERLKWAEYYVSTARYYHLSSVLWDNGIWDVTSEGEIIGELHREELKWHIPELIDKYITGSKTDFHNFAEDFDIELEDRFDKEKIITDEGEVEFDNTITSEQVVNEMGFGWNLGNTLDAVIWGLEGNNGLGSETSWGNPKTKEEMFKALAKKGVKTVRIPVSWHNHLLDEKYTIDPLWMKRVKEVVDWAIKQGLYVILNSHHDNAGLKEGESIHYGEGYYPSFKDIQQSERFIYNIWRQIAFAFNNGYDHHLIFEGLNEPRMAGHKYEWNYNNDDEECRFAAGILNEYMRLIVKAIRTTRGNNAKRFIMITPLAASFSSAANSNVIMPDDSLYNPKNNKLILSVHMYTPYNFALNGDMSYTEFTDAYREELYEDFVALYKKYVSKGYNIIIGEMGTVNKNNTYDRIEWAKYYVKKARQFHMSVIVWDNNIYDNTKGAAEIFGHFHRDTLEWEIEELMETYITYSDTKFEDIDINDLFAINPQRTFNRNGLIRDYNEVIFNDKMTAEQIANEVGMGWNLGNTLDAFNNNVEGHDQGLSSETSWGNPKTTEQMIKGLADRGFKTIRIPVTWHNHLIDDNYTIDPEWMQRVKKIVDWGIKYRLYVILNIHHDNFFYNENEDKSLEYGNGFYPNKRNIKESEKFIYNVWTQIATAFNNGYDHHLIFEGLNEPRLVGTRFEWSYQIMEPMCREANEVLNEYMRLIVKAIRETGGNNEKRFIMITPLSAGYQAAMESNVVFPDDTKYNPKNKKLILSVHMYAPYNFALNLDKSYNTFDQSGRDELKNNFASLYNKYIINDIQVIIGEMGVLNKNNDDQRIAWGDYYVTTARRYHLSSIVWDNGVYDTSLEGQEILGEYHRDTCTWNNEDLIDSYIKGSKTEFEDFE